MFGAAAVVVVVWSSEDLPIFLLEGIARTYRQAPTVSAVLKQTASPAGGLSPGRRK